MKKTLNPEEAENFQPILGDYLADSVNGNAEWLDERMEKDFSPEEKEQIKNDIISEVDSFNTELSSLKESLKAGDTKEEWLSDSLKQSLSQLSEDEYGKALAEVEQKFHEINEDTINSEYHTETLKNKEPIRESWTAEETTETIKQLLQEVKVGSLAGQVVSEGYSLAERLPDILDAGTIKGLEDIIRNGDDTEVKKAAAAALTAAVKKGYITALPKDMPVRTLTDIASGGVEQARVMLQYADGDISGSQVVEAVEDIATIQISRGFANAGEKLGRQIGQKVGIVVSSYIPFLAPVAVTIGTFVGATVGKFAGSKVGKTICKAAKKVKEVVKPILKSAWETVKSIGRSIWNAIFS